ncbi:hypothetical protein [uncultured Rubinisphaera sp.]|uniref:hypothetical protein n=1 Tax=uncultured Rubinisphaera sp. TaxID=1678686 RepID=UPI0030DC86CA
MSQSNDTQPEYSVIPVLQHDNPGLLIFTFLFPRSENNPNSHQVILVADLSTKAITIRSCLEDIDEATVQELTREVEQRLTLRSQWIARMKELVTTVEKIAKENDWKTKVLSKKLKDRAFGEHFVPSLVMQKDLCQLMLEAHGRTAPGVEGGFAGIYLMPAYDDAASLYFYNNCWNIHARERRSTVIARVAYGEARELTRESLVDILEGLHANAS